MPRFVRLHAAAPEPVRFAIDGVPAEAQPGDTLLTALLAAGKPLRHSDFGPESHAGFCLMGACQECTVQLADGRRLRACGTPVEAGMDVLTGHPAATPPDAVAPIGESA